MFDALQGLALILTMLALVPAFAHALELPGKARLSEAQYRAVQPIYYPGFTVAGFFESIAVVAAVALIAATPAGTLDFWLTICALALLLAMHAIYWLVTHPVNKAWLDTENLGRAGASFFGAGRHGANADEWTALRDRWEHSHLARAALGSAGFVALTVAVAAD